ncbi:glycosyltransferase [Desulfovibrio ferrophilus]|uniref:Glycosyl transferase, group 1 n=1 Tax=Desulfovibrio ferrophilus TaxID=241368 RepID=A0A2Z6B219_9BACT|nr:glycosyltransferase [Desulfovibrio ferrophilus]BBD09488.1 glycosyl transferase, group 1 [Desulfovibrio ferrophilus]
MKHPALCCDLHVHSRYSRRPSEWILQKIGCAESYTDPKSIYDIARRRGMDLVTITDHNVLEGSLEIAHLPGTFVSEEITTYFPEDQCKVHVLAWDITEAQHTDISKARENIFDLAQYLRSQNIVHAVAHPMFDMNSTLTPGHFEKLLLLFEVLELNGSRDHSPNEAIRLIVEQLTEADTLELAERHGFLSPLATPWKKSLVSGSDDHSSLNIARSHTSVADATGIRSFLNGLREGHSQPVQVPATPATMAHNLYSIAYQFYADKLGLAPMVSKDLLLRFMDRALTLREPERGNRLKARFHDMVTSLRAASVRRSQPTALKSILQKEALSIVWDDKTMIKGLSGRNDEPWKAERDWFTFVDRASEKVLKHFADTILESLGGADVFDLFKAIGSAGSSYIMLAPYMVAYNLYAQDRTFSRHCLDRMFQRKGRKTSRRPMRLAHFTDTFREMNGVAMTLRMQIEAARSNGKGLSIVTCYPEDEAETGKKPEGVRNFAPIGSFEIPEYPELVLHYPPLLKMLEWCYETGVTHIHAATPGPVGMAGLACAKILGLPLHSTYHTAFPQYASALTGDASMAEGMWRYMVWFSNQSDVVYAPSLSMANELTGKGVDAKRVRLYPRGVDVERFNPAKRNGFFKSGYGLDEGETKLLYVGRVSQEKNLHVLTGAFKRLAARRTGVRLVVVGNGPYLEQMQDELSGYPVTFTGPLTGDDLAAAYASASIFVFPSTTDTFGNVVLEAQASGLPVIVTDQGGPQENLIPGQTGLIVPDGDERHFERAMETLVDNPARVREMRHNARNYMEGRSFEASYLQLWELYREVSPC